MTLADPQPVPWAHLGDSRPRMGGRSFVAKDQKEWKTSRPREAALKGGGGRAEGRCKGIGNRRYFWTSPAATSGSAAGTRSAGDGVLPGPQAVGRVTHSFPPSHAHSGREGQAGVCPGQPHREAGPEAAGHQEMAQPLRPRGVRGQALPDVTSHLGRRWCPRLCRGVAVPTPGEHATCQSGSWGAGRGGRPAGSSAGSI